ncbi:IS3 family transposase [Peribacillus simplex]|uniref:IS3 family transposase n=1 Tax=Peribacillus simplex TaxID=1478 RepID=UPI0035D4C7B6
MKYNISQYFDELHRLNEEYMEEYNTNRYQWNLNRMTPAQRKKGQKRVMATFPSLSFCLTLC